MRFRRLALVTLLSLLFVQGEAFCACLQKDSSQAPQQTVEHHHHRDVSHEQAPGLTVDCGTNDCEHCNEAHHAARPELGAIIVKRTPISTQDNDSGEVGPGVSFPLFESLHPRDHRYPYLSFVASDSPVTRADALLE